jgi:PAS domain S-box-containing protein
LAYFSSAKSSEEALLRSREEARRLALVAERTDNAVIITDAMGKVEWVNEGFTRMSGYPREQVLRLNWAGIRRKTSSNWSDW